MSSSTGAPAGPAWDGRCWTPPAPTAGCYKLQLSADASQAFAFYAAAGLRRAARTYKQYLDDARP